MLTAILLTAAARLSAPSLEGAYAPGMERFDRVALLEASVLCGTRAGRAPVCAADARWRRYAAPYEALTDVARLAALNYAHCALHGDGRLRCVREAPHYPPKVAEPKAWPVVASGVADFVISTHQQIPLVFALTSKGDVMVLTPPLPTEEISAPRRVARRARSLASLGTGGACALIGPDDVRCSDVEMPTRPMRPIHAQGVIGLYYARVLLLSDGRSTGWQSDPKSKVKLIDYAPQGACVLTEEGAVECGGMGPRRRVSLPARATRFTPRGDALCARLVDGEIACFGPFLESLQRLAARGRRL